MKNEDILIFLLSYVGFLRVVNVYQFNIVVIMQWTFYYEAWPFKKKWIMYNNSKCTIVPYVQEMAY